MVSTVEFVPLPTFLISVSCTTSYGRKSLNRTRVVHGPPAVKPRRPSLMTCVRGIPPRAPPYRSRFPVVLDRSFALLIERKWRVTP